MMTFIGKGQNGNFSPSLYKRFFCSENAAKWKVRKNLHRKIIILQNEKTSFEYDKRMAKYKLLKCVEKCG